MIEIKTVIDKKAAEDFLRKQGACQELQAMTVISAWEEGEIVGIGAASVCAGCATIELVVCVIPIEWLVGKALVEVLNSSGIELVKIQNPSMDSLARTLSFKETDDGWKLELLGYFGGGCASCGIF